MTATPVPAARPKALFVGSSSDPHSVAAQVANSFYEGMPEVSLRAIGAGAVNQAAKATAITRSYVQERTKREVVAKVVFDSTMLTDRVSGELQERSVLVFVLWCV